MTDNWANDSKSLIWCESRLLLKLIFRFWHTLYILFWKEFVFTAAKDKISKKSYLYLTNITLI